LVGQTLADLVAKIRENISVRRAARVTVPDGMIVRCVSLHA
jgi:translation elongation factor EF-Ts